MINKMCVLRLTGITIVMLLFAGNIAGVAGEASNGKRYFDLRLSAGVGVFYYPQSVDGGYYINNVPYDLTWYGWQTQISGDAQFFFPWHAQLSLGLGGAYFLAINPKAMSANYEVNIDAKGNGKGGYGGLCASYWINEKWRINFLAGYGGTGVSDNYGGYGVTFSIGGTYLLSNNNLIGGIGAKFIYMNLYSPGDENTRSEKGGYMAMLVEASLDWTPKF